MDELRHAIWLHPQGSRKIAFLSRGAGWEVQRQTRVGRALTRWEDR
jgi:hypothetical protein